MEILEPTNQVRSPHVLYPWDVWLAEDGRPKLLDHEIDFPGSSVKNMQAYISQRTYALGKKVTTRILHNRYILFQVYDPATSGRPLLPDYDPQQGPRVRCRTCGRTLSRYAAPFGECRAQKTGPNVRTCKAQN